MFFFLFFFFFSSRRRHTRCSRDWSSDVCSSDLKILERYPSRILEPQVVVNSREQTLSFTATGMPYSTPDGCAPWAWASSDLRRSLGAVRQALRRLALTRRSAAALALASASLGSLT